MSEKRKVLRAAGIVGFFTLLSRFTGLARDMVTAAMFGGSRMADTFLTALELTNQVRRVLGEGSLSAFIVPILTERRQNEGAAAGWSLFNRAFNLMFVLSFAVMVVGVIFAPFIFGLFGGRALLVENKVLHAIETLQVQPGGATAEGIQAATGYPKQKVEVALESLTGGAKRKSGIPEDDSPVESPGPDGID